MKKLLFFSFFIYFLIAPITFHPDNKLVLFWAGQEQGQVWNIWEYGEKNFTTVGQFNYPPLHFYLDKVQYGVAKLIGGANFDEWLASSNATDPYEKNLVRYTVAIKFVLILFSLIVGYLIYLIAKQYSLTEKQSVTAASLWLLNPIVLYSIPAMGQNDVMAIMLFLIGWLLLARSKIAAVVLFGLSASVKMYPLLWLPFLLIPISKFSVKEKVILVIASLAVYVATLLPFISNSVFREAVLNSSINDRFFVANIDLGYSDLVMIVPLLLIIIFYGVIRKFNPQQVNSADQVLHTQSLAMMAVNLALLGFSHFHPQWFTWVVPFWALWFVIQKKSSQILIGITSLLTILAWSLVIILFQDSYLSQGLLVPVNAAFSNIPVTRDVLINKGFDVIKYSNLAHTWLAGIAIVLVIYIFSKKDEQKSLQNETLFKLKWTSIKIPKMVQYLLILLASKLIIFSILAVSYLLPIPRSSAPPTTAKYDALVTESKFEFVAEHNNLNRVDISFRNPNLANTDTYIFDVLDERQSVITQVPFSGSNTGDPGVIRFNLPTQVNSKDKRYTIRFVPTSLSPENSEQRLGVGITEGNQLAQKTYYGHEAGLNRAVNQAAAAYLNSIYQVPWLYALVLIALYFAL